MQDYRDSFVQKRTGRKQLLRSHYPAFQLSASGSSGLTVTAGALGSTDASSIAPRLSKSDQYTGPHLQICVVSTIQVHLQYIQSRFLCGCFRSNKSQSIMTFRWGSEKYFVINNILISKGCKALLHREEGDTVSAPMDPLALTDHLLQMWVQPK